MQLRSPMLPGLRLRCGSRRRGSFFGGLAFLFQQLRGLRAQAVVRCLHLRNGCLGFGGNPLRFSGLLLRHLLLARVFGLVGFQLLANHLGVFHQFGIVLVHVVEDVPVRGEFSKEDEPNKTSRKVLLPERYMLLARVLSWFWYCSICAFS